MFRKKAQEQIMSVVIITGIIISLVGVAYLWGKPLIEKRTTIAEYSTIESFILNLNDKIIDIANSGSGKHSIDIPLGSIRAIAYNPSNLAGSNMLVFEHTISQPILLGSTVPVKTNNLEEVAMYGDSQPRIITMSVSPYNNQYIMNMTLHYRELDTNTIPRKGFLIQLVPVTSSGRKTIVVSFGGNQVIPGAAANRGDLVVTKINVELA
jgi:hypothetical protein